MLGDCLIGYSGFVGSNLANRHHFSGLYRASNIEQIRNQQYDLLICAAPSAAKWRANQEPELDRSVIDRLANNIAESKARRAILLSTVDVYPVTVDVDEAFDCGGLKNNAYGENRLHLETRMREIFRELYIVRLPGLFGSGLKKNVVFDLIHHNCLAAVNPLSVFQYYDVSRLWEDLQTIQKAQIPLINLATKPLETRTVLDSFFPSLEVGWEASPVARYSVRTKYASIFGRTGHFRFGAQEVMDQLKRFIESEQALTAVGVSS